MNKSVTNYQTPQMVQNKIGSSGTDIKDITRSFYSTMRSMLVDYADSQSDITINGIQVKAKDKYGIVGTLLYSQFMTDTTKAIETVMGFKTSLFSLEKQLTSKMGG
ncbi:hypothetical protein A2276_05630 [candidate division WOR-1 bacterium RIFOXYA12_FULL_43_27]|uniref:Uncharacterized protein n=1 Tax=candidate division WOR-1 bacterium RIFOXYC2_FULL_46_14 TaxID=1802587 RepID=A0A1F4U3G7_UNCSA|nr:MAG: hypothetical protein A2276_05630 [candidate division WOR-1 bacterium RIFOXYA12_FULL_43_27]OGC20146.1 MAG: hypothetical protein A2292_03635 [candidate division WOR-1 bacterium RIFOXYB2_FULL_46_45]OGC32117.1 MAG: hypothetical protein A2232_07815 [candidate division WOR-1 bacterium RIFOXYA2_FULL_46_56]OGC39518.1 MAG: hypothetical protein A2438_08180 [candidate division WOR-1 bacterium RIFOXYC2_FULL_46_14]